MKAYLDYAATTPLDGEILEKMLPLLKGEFGNPDSLHAYGRKAAYLVSEARDRVAGVLGVEPAEVYFTSGGTEADNWAMRSLGEGSVLFSAVEHRAVIESAALRTGGAYAVPVEENGLVTPAAVEKAFRADTGLVSVMAVNNETGCIQPVEEIAKLCHARGALFFSDCVQAAGTQNLKELARCCDALSLSAHKIYGPKGTGALVVKKGARLTPLVAGGEQERGLRGGTLNTAGIVGFSFALEKAQRTREENNGKLLRLKGLFEARVKEGLRGAVRIDGDSRSPNISHLTLSRGGSALIARLDLEGVACSGGAACSAHSPLPSHVLVAMGRREEEAARGVRFSFGRQTTKEEVLFAADTLIRLAGE